MTQEEVNALYELALDVERHDVRVGRFAKLLVEHLAGTQGLAVQEGPPPEEQVVTEVPPVEERAANATEPQAVATKAGGTTWQAPESSLEKGDDDETQPLKWEKGK